MEFNTAVYDLEHPLLLSKFSNIDIARDEVKGWPDDFRNTLASGALSPLILLHLEYPENTFVFPAKLRIGLNEKTGQQELFIYGVKKDPLSTSFELDPKQLERALKGDVILYSDNKGEYVIQYDKETNNMLKVPYKDIRFEEKLNSVDKILDIELGKEQKQRIREGKPVTLNVGGEDVTVGVDLKSPNAFKQLKGDMKEWERQKAIEYDIAHPEYLGLVKTVQNRWEYQQIQLHGMEAPKLKEAPQQVKAAGMKI